MRIVFAVLLVANLVLAGLGFLSWQQHDGPRGKAGAAREEPRIRIVQGEPEPKPPHADQPPPQTATGEGPADAAAAPTAGGEPPTAPPMPVPPEAPAAAPAPSTTPVAPAPSAATAAPAAETACVEIAPLSQEELARIRQSLATLKLADRATVAPVPATASWWVYIPPKGSREQAEKEVARLNAAGVRDTYVVQDTSDMRHAISLGIFRTRDGADRFAEGLRAKGVRNAVVDLRPLQIRLSAIYVREPDPAQTERMLELKAVFPGAEIRATACPR
jgi:hypothetical protein